MSRFFAIALGLLIGGVALGLALRFGQLVPLGVPAQNATHAHSHALYWGWAGLALFTFFFERVGLTGRWPKVVLALLSLQSLATLGVFYRFGYERPGVVLSALTLVPFLSAVVMFLVAARGKREADLSFLRAATLFVVLAYVSALGRVVIKVMAVADPIWAALAVHVFLGAFGAFFVLGLMGLTVRALGPSRGRVLGLVLGTSAPLIAWPSLLSIPGIEHTVLGPVAQLAAVAMVVPGAAWLAWVWRASSGDEGRFFWRSAAACWATSVLLFALVSTGAMDGLVHNRHAVVLAVHLQTLGVVTSSLLLLILRRLSVSARGPLALHQAGVGLMLAALGAAALMPSRLALWSAGVAGALAFAAQLWITVRVVRALPIGGSGRLASHKPG